MSFFTPGGALAAGRFRQTLAVWAGGLAAGLAQVLGEAELKLDHDDDSVSLLGKDSGSEGNSHPWELSASASGGKSAIAK